MCFCQRDEVNDCQLAGIVNGFVIEPGVPGVIIGLVCQDFSLGIFAVFIRVNPMLIKATIEIHAAVGLRL